MHFFKVYLFARLSSTQLEKKLCELKKVRSNIKNEGQALKVSNTQVNLILFTHFSAFLFLLKNLRNLQKASPPPINTFYL